MRKNFVKVEELGENQIEDGCVGKSGFIISIGERESSK
jgi:hypothetical protein